MPRTSPRPTTTSKIQRIRIALGMTQAQLAAKINCTQKDVSRWERGVYTPTARWLPHIAKALNCSIDYLLTEED